ncbi:deformed epidermal autoregulatory factor 1 homolog isoform X1 [Corythoichthys intestinalis]|uniref:deformed epidermal autoregulatory factor 1 homolog isoform X1 n=1 Tax=Corythoichthys intestinalis TaxID=161448 RepID=UPI0025A5FE07|nr:deformed epidermal autoregulatory factor 1 homolog isoform X1 [Corythoichthys intestinalis]
MDEAESATKALGLDEPPQRAGSDTESEAEVSTMAVMAAPGNIDMGAEAMPNADESESAFPEVSTVAVEDVQTTDNSVFNSPVDSVETLPEHVLSGRSNIELGEGLSSQKTTLMVVHTDSNIVEDRLKSTSAISTGLVTPPNLLTPPQDKDPNSKYNWDPSVYNNELPVRCRNSSGILFKNRLGSGGKGRCIKHNQQWLTPTEFEGLAGRASSKDWKRSIRYAGRPLLCLIQDRILNPHAASCTCAACSDSMTLDGDSLEDENITMNGPVRLFVPYKRRRKETDPAPVPIKKDIPASKNITLTPGTTFTVSPVGQITPSGTLSFERSPSGDAATIISDASAQSEVYTDTSVLTALPALALSPQAKMAVASPSASLMGTLEVRPIVGPVAGATVAVGPPLLSESPKNTWLYLEEMANTLMSNVQNLKALIEQAKKENRVHKECAVSQSFQNQITFQTPDDSQAKRSTDITEVILNMCENCGRLAQNECTGCRKVNYCSTFCQRKDWREHQNACCQSGGGGVIPEDEPMASVGMDKVK